MREFETNKSLLNRRCLVCKKKFKLNEKIILHAIQAPKEEGHFINAIAIPIHTSCYFVEKGDKK